MSATWPCTMRRGAVPAPCNLPFAWNRIQAEAEPDAETMLVADVPLEALREARARGTVQNLNDRRPDLYTGGCKA